MTHSQRAWRRLAAARWFLGVLALALIGAASAWNTSVSGRSASAEWETVRGDVVATPFQAVQDRGIGIVTFDQGAGADTRSGGASGRMMADSLVADTIVLLRDTTGRQVAARFILRTNGSSWSYAIESRESVERASLEFEYEVEGLPVDLATVDARWVRAIYGTTPDGSARRGWIRLTPGLTRYETWTPILVERSVFFDTGIAPEFYGSPGGPVVPFPVEHFPDGRADYIMHPMDVRADGGWMRVRVATPSDMCGGPDSVRQATLWIRYLSESGRPRVWYHTRGC